MTGNDVLTATREIQLPLLAILLMGACVAKARRAITMRSIEAGTGPSAVFPVRLRRPAAIGLCFTELVLGIGLLLTAGRFGAGEPALVIRAATALLFCTAVGALYVLREREPGAGCGCFGELSDTPVGWRTITRAALLGVAALASIGAPPWHTAQSEWQAAALVLVTAAELGVLAVLSPEIGQVIVRLSHDVPCEVREIPVARTLAALRATAHWRRYQPFLVGPGPSDVWREGCWRFLVFPGILAGRTVDVVFAISLDSRRAQVHVGLVDTGDTGDTGLEEMPFAAPLQVSNHV
jgi:hypothetical protein